jgi:hypothetical protein
MYLKIMSGEDKADADYTKKFSMVEVVYFSFYNRDGHSWVGYDDINGRPGESMIAGNVYVLNGTGKTIETWSASSK